MLIPVSTSTLRRSPVRPLLALALLLALLLVSLRDAPPPPIPALPAAHPASASASSDAMAALPAQMRAHIFAQFGQDDPAAQLHASADGAIRAPAIGGLAVRLDATTLRLGGPQPSWQWTLRGWGRAAALAAPAQARALVQANRARYALGGLEAWYIAGPDRLEQGWTIAARPAGTGPLLLTFAEAGQLRAELAHDGQGLDLRDAVGVSSLRYDGLLASDARGRRLPARFTRQGDGLAIAVDDTAASYPLTIDPLVQVARLSIRTSFYGDCFGAAVALSADGSTLVAGAFQNNAGGVQRGAVYVYTRPAGGWASISPPTAILTNATGAGGDGLGSAVALSADGSTIVAAREMADDTRSGAAYVYTRPAGGWATTDAPIAWLTVAGAVGNWFGWALALNPDGSTIVAGAPHAAAGGTARGALYSYTKPAGGWATTDAPTATFTATPGLDGNQLGWAVALSADGRTLVGGAAPAALVLPAYYSGIYIFRDRTTNAILSGLALSQGTLSPAFAIGTRAYTATVAYSVSSITVTPTLADADATVTVNSMPVSSGSASGALSLRPGPNLITVVVTAEDPAIRTTTTITVTRPARIWLPMLMR